MPAKPIPQHVEPFQAIFATPTWAQQYSAEMASDVPIANLRVSICNRLWNQWDIRMIPTDLELRYMLILTEMFSKYPMTRLSFACWRSTDLSGV